MSPTVWWAALADGTWLWRPYCPCRELTRHGGKAKACRCPPAAACARASVRGRAHSPGLHHGRTSCRKQPVARTYLGGLAYAAVVAKRAGPLQPIGPYKPPAQDSDHFEPTASCEAATRRMSLGDVRASVWYDCWYRFKYPSGHY